MLQKFDINGKFWLYTGPLEIDVASGDPLIIFDTNGSDRWCIGVDDDDSDKFKIHTGGALGVSGAVVINTSQEMGIGDDPVNGHKLFIYAGPLLMTNHYSINWKNTGGTSVALLKLSDSDIFYK